MNRTFVRLGFTAFALAAGSHALLAQQSTGGLVGRIVDDKGVPKPGVSATIVHQGTGFTRATKSDALGRFSFPALPIGLYQVSYAAEDQTFKRIVRVSLGQDTDASFLKWPSAQGAVVVITASGVQTEVIDSASAQVGTTVGSEVIEQLPIISRDINQAAILAPGVGIVAGSQVDPTKKTSSYIMTGDGMGRGTSFAVDGADNNSSDVGGYVLKIPIDAIAEFQVVTNQYKAEFGRSTAGFFNVVTKSGGNEFAGSVNSQYTNDSLRARRTDEGTKTESTLGSYAATVSGPILKDKLFFMVSAERQQGHSAAFDFQPYAISLDPTLGGIRTELLAKNVIGKLDWNMADNLTTSWSYGYYQDETPHQAFPRTTGFGGNVPASALGTGANKTWAAGTRLTWNVNSKMVFESHLSYFDYKNGIRPDSLGPSNGSPMALLDVSTPVSPRLDASNLGYGGIDPNAFQNTGIKRTQWKNELTYLEGSHTIKGGIELQRTTYADQQLFFSETGINAVRVAGVNYMSGWNQSVLPDVNVLRVGFVPNGFNQGISYKQYGLYLQDDFHLNANWSLYGGLRLDWDTQLDYIKERFANIYATIHANNPGLVGIGASAPEGKKYFEPRFQALYRPNGDDKLVFKFGYGHFVANVIDNVTGFSRSLSNRVNGLPLGARNLAAYAAQGLAAPTVDPVASFTQGTQIGIVNGHPIILPADLTPYNYANNVNGLRDYFRNTVDGWLTVATADTDGKNLLASDFQYPTKDAVNVGVSYRRDEHHAGEAMLVYEKSRHMTVLLAGPDGSLPELTEVDSAGNQIGDNIFFSNQTASAIQLQLKYSYTNANTSFLASLVIKNQRSSEGGAAGAFDASGATGGLYGEGARFPYRTNPERRSPGTERLAGSFSFAHRFSFGTTVSALASWHSGKAYDVTEAFNADFGPVQNPQNPPAGTVDQSHPASILGYQEGRWAMDLSLKVSQTIKFGKKLSMEPYVVIQNLLNNYDYGANYNGLKYLNLPGGPFNAGSPDSPGSGFGERGQAYQANQPRNGAIGLRLTF